MRQPRHDRARWRRQRAASAGTARMGAGLEIKRSNRNVAGSMRRELSPSSIASRHGRRTHVRSRAGTQFLWAVSGT
jgi:hypothetical protein